MTKESPTPRANGRAFTRSFTQDLGYDPLGHEHTMTTSARYNAADGLTVTNFDDSQWPAEDMLITETVGPEHIDGLRKALGAIDGEGLLDLIERRWDDGSLPTSLDSWGLRQQGVEYTRVVKFYQN